MAAERITITVNGREADVAPGTLLAALRNLGVRVPTLCHDDRLTPYGGCRLCVVARRDGRGGLVAACSQPVERGMIVETDAEEVVRARRSQLELLLLDHRMDCPVCERRGDCRFQELLFEYGVGEARLPFDRLHSPREERSPLIVRDNEKCILCGKCARLCEEVQGVAEIGLVNRGLGARVGTMLDRPLDCEFCGQCADACPVGALFARPFVSGVPVWQRSAVQTTCSYCSCGCQITVEHHDGRLQRVTADPAQAPNHGSLCVKGRFGWDVLSSEERLIRPLIRRAGQLCEASWEEALGAVANAMRASLEAKRTAVALGSARLTTEDAYLLQRLMRSVLGSPHVDGGAGWGITALAEGIAPVTGTPRSTATIDDVRAADLVLVLRGDPARSHPMMRNELLAGIRRRGQKVVLLHGLSGTFSRHARHVAVQAGAEDDLLAGLMRELLAGARVPAEAIATLAGYEEWRASLDAYDPSAVAALTGVAPAALAQLADEIAAASRVALVVITGRGIPGDEAAAARASAQLAAILTAAGKPAGVIVLGERANVQGVLDAGLHAALLPGGRSAAHEGDRAVCAETWGRPVPAGPGWGVREAMARAAAGEIDLLYLVGRDPVDVWPHAQSVRAAIDAARFVVVQDPFLSETARLADVVLPCTLLIEREGTLVGADGVARRARRAVAPRAGLPGDGQIFAELARRLGTLLPQGEALATEMRRLLDVARPASAPCLQALPAPVKVAPGAGFVLDAAPQLFHSGCVTRRSRTLQSLSPLVSARLAPADAQRLGVAGGEMLRVSSESSSVHLHVRLDRSVRRGSVLALWHSTGKDASASADDGAATVIDVRRSQ